MNIYYWLLLPEPDKATQHDHMKARAGVKVECGDLFLQNFLYLMASFMASAVVLQMVDKKKP